MQEMTRGKKRSPEDIERGLEALAESGGNAEEASRKTGLPANTLREWKLQFGDEFGELRREKRSDLITKVWVAAEKALDTAVEKLAEMSGKDAAVSFGIFTDKGLLMGGEPTGINENREKPMIYLPKVEDDPLEGEPGTSVEVPSKPGV